MHGLIRPSDMKKTDTKIKKYHMYSSVKEIVNIKLLFRLLALFVFLSLLNLLRSLHCAYTQIYNTYTHTYT